MEPKRIVIAAAGPLAAAVVATLLLAAAPAVGQEQRSVQPSGEQPEPPLGNTLVPFPVLFQQPETGTGFGAAATYFFRSSRSASAAHANQTAPSTVSGFAAYTTHGQVITEFGAELYLDQNRLRIDGGFEYAKFPTAFWGIGNDTPSAMEEAYTPETLGFGFDIRRQFSAGWYWGIGLEASNRRLAKIERGGMLARQIVPGTTDGKFVGLGAGVVHDTRDNTVYPNSGLLQELRVFRFDSFIGSDFDYTSMTVDLRKYQSLLPSHVLALRVLGRAQFGDPPFDALPQLGGAELSRGYYGGRFRDRHLLAVQTEYRLPLVWRLGVVGFAEAGQVASAWDEFRVGRTKVSAGGGLRFLLSPKERLALRIDYGWGFSTATGGLYISLGEAF